MDDLSPLDGRYKGKTKALRPYFSEWALMRARVIVELRYLQALSAESKIPQLKKLNKKQIAALQKIITAFSENEAKKIKKIEAKTNHDVKAVEYYLKERIKKIPGLKQITEFIHFALTSEDVNNLAYGILIHEGLKEILIPKLKSLIAALKKPGKRWQKIEILSLTHGQPATPSTMGKELLVFAGRLERQLTQLTKFKMQGKFGGAVGNYSAHKAAYPAVKWEQFGKKFIKSLKLDPLTTSTQINPHDDLAELSHLYFRVNTILLDASRDFWLYIMRGILKQKTIKGEVGSSTMPHKVNPIDFENAEGNVGLSNALFDHFATKLPVSRLQRDLSDSTVQRNIGAAFGYHLIAVESFSKGLSKIDVDRKAIKNELEDHPEVRAEAIQTVMRKHGVPGAYEKLKAVTRGEKITKKELMNFTSRLLIPKKEVERLRRMFS